MTKLEVIQILQDQINAIQGNETSVELYATEKSEAMTDGEKKVAVDMLQFAIEEIGNIEGE